ncbi:19415_t:CDS:2, partial [Gigaspora margarita]
NYKKRPESLAKQVWEVVRNDSTPDRKKFLGMLTYNQMVINPKTQEEKHYSKNIGKINLAKVIPLYKKYVYCSFNRWIEIKKYQLR